MKYENDSFDYVKLCNYLYLIDIFYLNDIIILVKKGIKLFFIYNYN